MIPPSRSHPLLEDRLHRIRDRIADACQRAERRSDEVTLIAVTKMVSAEMALAMTELGVLDLGEGRPQELWKKAAAVPNVRWHLVGHLQRNKIDRTIPLTTLVHAVDSDRLLQALDQFGRKQPSPIQVLLEVNCSREISKGGFTPEALPKVADEIGFMTGVTVQGLMTMAAHEADSTHCRPTFAELRTLRNALRVRTGLTLPYLSMGMSNDFEVAVEEGSTHVRIGTTLFEGLGES